MSRDEANPVQNNAQFRELFNTMALGVVYQNADGHIIAANPAAERLLGLSCDQMMGRQSIDPRWRAVHEDGSPFPGDTHPAMVALQTGKAVKNTVMGVFHPKNEAYVWININAIPQFREGETTPYQVYATFDDITDLKTNADQLRLTLAELERTNQDLARFAYIASHDLQEPLNTISNFVDLLQARYAPQIDDKGRIFLQYVQEGALRMKQLINALLAYSRLTRATIVYEPVSCDRLIQTVLANLQDAIQRCDAVVHVTECAQIMGNEALLRQLLQNLIANGIKFRHPDRRPELWLSVVEKGDLWLGTVHDNGIGIESRHHQQIFEIFRRLHTQNDYEGTGLGLALCRQIVALHGGEIWVDSEFGSGSTFYFTLHKKKTGMGSDAETKYDSFN